MTVNARPETIARWQYALELDPRLSPLARGVGRAAHDHDGWIDETEIAERHDVTVSDVWAALDDLQALDYVNVWQDGFIFRRYSGHKPVRAAYQIRRRIDTLGLAQPAGTWGARVG